jgi:hypothetical protein
MRCTLTVLCLLLNSCQDAPPEPADRLKELTGQWVVLDSDSSGYDDKDYPAKLLGLTAKGTEITIKGNQLSSGGKGLATLTTDLSDFGPDLDKKVRVRRRPVLVTLPTGRGLLCAYEPHSGGGFTLFYPHTMGGISAGTRLSIGPPAK